MRRKPTYANQPKPCPVCYSVMQLTGKDKWLCPREPHKPAAIALAAASGP